MACGMLWVKAGVPSQFLEPPSASPTPDPTPGPMVPTFSGFKLYFPTSQYPLSQEHKHGVCFHHLELQRLVALVSMFTLWKLRLQLSLSAPAPVYFTSTSGFPHSSVSKESACKAGDLGSIPGSEISPGEGNGNPLQYSCLEKPMGRGAWLATVHGVSRVRHDLATKPLPPHLNYHLKGTCLPLARNTGVPSVQTSFDQ